MTSSSSVYAPAASTTKRVFQRTQLCAFWARGNCKRGAACAFAHGEEQLRESPNLSKTKICKSFQRGECMSGDGCTFAHRREDLRILRPKKVNEGKSNVLMEVFKHKPSKVSKKVSEDRDSHDAPPPSESADAESLSAFVMGDNDVYVVEPEKTQEVIQQLLFEDSAFNGSIPMPANLLFRL
mmetsp:Transcript_42984/g.68094  ORF Transcript_42984/g.68094 Transcript_42984/m.68094 type:complete len:182 (+) Transcript_42984:101-646(+)